MRLAQPIGAAKLSVVGCAGLGIDCNNDCSCLETQSLKYTWRQSHASICLIVKEVKTMHYDVSYKGKADREAVLDRLSHG